MDIEKIKAALEEDELSHMICGLAHCRCAGDENGADTDKAFCFLLAKQIRAKILDG